MGELEGMAWKAIFTKAEGAEKVVQWREVIPAAREACWVWVRWAQWWISYSGIVVGCGWYWSCCSCSRVLAVGLMGFFGGSLGS